tara:strand:- start:140 stop:595 length:456 start_codon:yes stop_codon:yes gene_type:complete
MNKFIIAIMFIGFFSCNESQLKELNFYGEKITLNNISDFEMVKKLAENQAEVETKIEGIILSTCPKKGCWMNVRVDKDTILVRFKDYGFFVPKQGQENNRVVMLGKAKKDTISVDLLRHYAEDANKSIEEIEKITQPEYKISFLADGVIIN